MEDYANEPQALALATDLEDSFFETRRFRHDGWDGPTKALFCRTLAETGIVRDACRACNMSAQSAYALRHRDSLFARAWEAALSMARERLADELLARSLKGSAEQIMREGCIWGERHTFDNKLAFAILRRLDRRAELGATFRTPPVHQTPVALPAVSGDWQLLLDAMSEDRTADAEQLLTPVQVKVDEVDNPLICDAEGDTDDTPEEPQRVWQQWPSNEWRTDFPPPAGFDGDEYGDWEDPEGYSRTLTEDELAALVAAGRAEPDEVPTEITLEDDEAARDAFFASLSARAE